MRTQKNPKVFWCLAGSIILAATLAAFALFPSTVSRMLSSSAIQAIVFYQRFLHPITHRFVRCRLTPTCSAFALHEFQTEGFSRSLGATGKRLVLCARTPAVPPVAVVPVQGATLAVIALQRPEDQAAAAACCASVGVLIAFFVGLFVLGIVLLVWVAKDAKARGVDNPILWMLLVLCTSVLGLIIYLATRPKGNLVQCQNCPNKKLPYARTCPHCGNVDVRVTTPS